MRKTILAVALAAVLVPLGAGCSSRSGESGKGAETAHDAMGKMSVDELTAKMADAKAGKLALFIYDNNHKERFDQSHIPGAKWVEFDKVSAADLPQDKEATLVFYCANEH
jgi:hypothetical protein